MKKILLLIAIVFMLVTIAFGIVSFTQIFKRNHSTLPNINITTENEVNVEDIPLVSIVAENLSIPWALAFLPASSSQDGPDKRLMVNEREGKIKLIDNGKIIEIAEIDVHSE